MPLTISVRHDYHRIEAALTDLHRRQLPFATAAALTDAARAAQSAVTAELPEIFDRPIPFTMKAIGMSPAHKADLTAEVFVKRTQAEYLYREEVGGTRTGAENTHSPSTALILPSKIKLNAYGNLPFGALKRLVAEADEKREQTAKQLRRKKKTDAARPNRDKGIFYMAGKSPWGAGPGGFFKRLPGHKLQRLLSFEPSATYKPRFGFRARVQVAATQAFATSFAKRLREAIATAR